MSFRKLRASPVKRLRGTNISKLTATWTKDRNLEKETELIKHNKLNNRLVTLTPISYLMHHPIELVVSKFLKRS